MRSLPLPSTGIRSARPSWRVSCCSSLQPDMLCLADRAFVGFELWRTAAASGAGPALAGAQEPGAALPRAADRRLVPEPPLCFTQAPPSRGWRDDGRRVIDYRLEGVPGCRAALPAGHHACSIRPEPQRKELAALYHERWESEGAFAELKVSAAWAAADAAQPAGGPRRAGALWLAPGPFRPAPPDPRRQPPGRLRSRHPVLHPHGAHRPAASAVPCCVFPLTGGAACLSWS